MKKLLLIAFIAVSCSKSEIESSSIADGSIQYRVDGNLVKIDNKSIQDAEYTLFSKQLKGALIENTRYLFNGQKGVNNILIFAIPAENLSIKNYTIDSMYVANNSSALCTLSYNGEISTLHYKSDYINVNITSYSNDAISGNFTGRLTSIENVSDYSERGTTIITEGEFKNIKCIY